MHNEYKNQMPRPLNDDSFSKAHPFLHAWKRWSTPCTCWPVPNCTQHTVLNREKFRIKTNQSKNRTVPDLVHTSDSLLKERFLIGWKSLGGPQGPGWSRHTVIFCLFYKLKWMLIKLFICVLFSWRSWGRNFCLDDVLWFWDKKQIINYKSVYCEKRKVKRCKDLLPLYMALC